MRPPGIRLETVKGRLVPIMTLIIPEGRPLRLGQARAREIVKHYDKIKTFAEATITRDD